LLCKFRISGKIKGVEELEHLTQKVTLFNLPLICIINIKVDKPQFLVIVVRSISPSPHPYLLFVSEMEVEGGI
jgi:hypothetical protein